MAQSSLHGRRLLYVVVDLPGACEVVVRKSPWLDLEVLPLDARC
jgi:hypothetical protein